MRFTKMQGAGNDYIYLNGFEKLPADLSALSRRMSDRHFGIGADGIVVIMPSDHCDFRMRMFNADGTEAEMCGNASRCIGKYVYDKGLTSKTQLTLETLAGIKHLILDVKNGTVNRVSVDMGNPILSAPKIPVNTSLSEIISYPLEIENNTFNITCVSMGNPHTVIFLNEMERYDLHHIGALIEHHELFPKRTNVEFVEILSPDHLKMRVWERGTGETLACGTGACASLVAAVLNGKANRKVVVTGIEMFRKLLDYAEAGDNIGALLRGVQRNEIERGQVLSKPGTIHPHTKFKGEVYVLTKDEGGRHTPFFNNYRPQFYFRTTDVTGVITLPEGTEMCMPGDNVKMEVELITPIAIEKGLRFAIREGGRTVGSGVVSEIEEA